MVLKLLQTKKLGRQKKGKREEQFLESVHCYSPTPPIGRRRTKKREEQFSESVHCYSPTPPIGRRT